MPRIGVSLRCIRWLLAYFQEESHSCVASVFTEQTPSSEHDYPPTNAHSAADVSVHTDQIHDVERESDHSANVQQTGEYFFVLIGNPLHVTNSCALGQIATFIVSLEEKRKKFDRNSWFLCQIEEMFTFLSVENVRK